MAQRSGALAALPEDLSSVPGTSVSLLPLPVTPATGNGMLSSVLLGHWHTRGTHTSIYTEIAELPFVREVHRN